MSEEEPRLAQERQRQAARADEMRPAVLALLKQIAPRASFETLATACEEVVRSVLSYELGVRDAQVEPLKLKRKNLQRMKRAFENCLQVLDPDPFSHHAYHVFRISQFNQRESSGDVRELKRQLTSAISAVDTSLKILMHEPGHQSDLNRVRLAAEIRLTLGKTLGLRVVMKQDVELKSAKPGRHANFSRVLRLALELAGETPADDLHYFMKKGRKYLREEGVAVLGRILSDAFPGDIAYMGKKEKFDV